MQSIASETVWFKQDMPLAAGDLHNTDLPPGTLAANAFALCFPSGSIELPCLKGNDLNGTGVDFPTASYCININSPLRGATVLLRY